MLQKATTFWRTQWLLLAITAVIVLTFSITVAIALLIIVFHYFVHKNNPYTTGSYFKQPYSTEYSNGEITYHKQYNFIVYGSKIASLYGYYVSGFLIAKNTLFGGKPLNEDTEPEIIAEIHRQRFDPTRPYLISGDQFSVLYPRNLGVFYNQLLNPVIAHDQKDWQNKQQIYLQSVLIAIDGLSASTDPRTTIVPIGPRQAALTQVHPGGYGSDQVYGLLYAIDQLLTPTEPLKKQTVEAAHKILQERAPELKLIVDNYIQTVQDKNTKLVKTALHLASARDGVVRAGSFYDNVILWKTLQLANKLGIYKIDHLDQLKQLITDRYWNESRGYFNDDTNTAEFSSDWLIGFPAGFFDLNNTEDLHKAIAAVKYVESTNLVKPFPIKYQNKGAHSIPWFVKLIVPNYGSSAIWSYWGCEYITLLMKLYEKNGDRQYLNLAQTYVDSYRATILRDRGFAETFDEEGNFLQSSLYKSIRVTGWVVQYEYAVHLLNNAISFDKENVK